MEKENEVWGERRVKGLFYEEFLGRRNARRWWRRKWWKEVRKNINKMNDDERSAGDMDD